MSRVHDYNNFAQDISLHRYEEHVNGSDWDKIRRTYSDALIHHYHAHHFARHHIKFSTMLQRDLAKSIIERCGRFREFRVGMVVYQNELPDAKRPWMHRGTKKHFCIHPEDDLFYQRIVEKVSIAGETTAAVYDMSVAPPKLLVRHEDSHLPANKHILGQLMQSEPYQYGILVRRGTTSARIADGIFIPEHLVRTPQPPPIQAPLLQEPQPTEDVTTRIFEQIACEMCKRKRSHRSIKEQAFVSEAVQAAITNDSLYPHGGAAAYWHPRGVNIGDLVNEVAHAVHAKTCTLDARALFDRRIGSEAIAQKALHKVTIEGELWERFKEWTGYHGTHDDGGPDQGPSGAHKRALGVPVHTRIYQSEFPLEETTVTAVAEWEDADAPSIIAPVVIRGTARPPHQPKFGRYCCSEDEYSASSDDETAVMRRTKQRSLHLVEEISSEEDDLADYLQMDLYSNFVEIFSRAYPKPEELIAGKPYLVLMPPNAVFNRKNMERVVVGVETDKRSYREFVRHYMIPLESSQQFASIATSEKTIKLVSMSNVVYTVTHPGRVLQLKEKIKLSDDLDPHLGTQIFLLRGYPTNIRVCPLHILHHNFPRV